MDKHDLGGLAELGHGIEHVNEHVVGHALGEPIPKMGSPKLLYLLVHFDGVGDCAEDL